MLRAQPPRPAGDRVGPARHAGRRDILGADGARAPTDRLGAGHGGHAIRALRRLIGSALLCYIVVHVLLGLWWHRRR